jgi:hypothetical protein
VNVLRKSSQFQAECFHLFMPREPTGGFLAKCYLDSLKYCVLNHSLIETKLSNSLEIGIIQLVLINSSVTY